jgi:hypothetical protein
VRGGLVVEFGDRQQRLADPDGDALCGVQCDDTAGERRRHLDDRLRRLDLDDVLVSGDLVALGDEPAHDLSLGEPLAEVGEEERLLRHQSSHCRSSTASSTRSTLGSW